MTTEPTPGDRIELVVEPTQESNIKELGSIQPEQTPREASETNRDERIFQYVCAGGIAGGLTGIAIGLGLENETVKGAGYGILIADTVMFLGY